MIKNLVMCPVKIDTVNCFDVRSDQLQVLDEASKNRGWQTIINSDLRTFSNPDFDSFLEGLEQFENCHYIRGIGFKDREKIINKRYLSAIDSCKGAFLNLTISSIEELESLSSETSSIPIVLRVLNPSLYRKILENNDLLSSFKGRVAISLGETDLRNDHLIKSLTNENIYVIIDGIKWNSNLTDSLYDLSKIIIISQFNDFELNLVPSSKKDTWDCFRKGGVSEMVSILRNIGFSEKEINKVTYHNVISLLSL